MWKACTGILVALTIATFVYTIQVAAYDNRDLQELCSHPTEQLLEINRPLKKYLKSLLKTYYFQYIKLNLQRECLFFKSDPVCTSEDECRASASSSAYGNFPFSWNAKESHKLDDSPADANINFALFDKESDDSPTSISLYYNLLENPERYTGYSGKDANRIWHAMYLENCHYVSEPIGNSSLTANPELSDNVFAQPPDDVCMERTLFYRIVSGMHTSVSVHLSYKHFNQSSGLFEPNVDAYNNRVGFFPERKANFYLTYVLLFRAIQKLSPFIHSQFNFFSKEAPADEQKTRDILYKISELSLKCPNFFNEQMLFNTETNPDALLLKQSFRDHFRNISRILDCVACQRCRLWGKIQAIGLGTALKILFSYPEDMSNCTLSRVEIVALFNTIGKYTETMFYIQKFDNISLNSSPITKETNVVDDSNKLLFPFSLMTIFLFVFVIISSCFYFRYLKGKQRKTSIFLLLASPCNSELIESPNDPGFGNNKTGQVQKRLGRSADNLTCE